MINLSIALVIIDCLDINVSLRLKSALQEATELGKKARELKKAAEALHQEERSGNKGRKWRKNVKAVEKVHCTHLYLNCFSQALVMFIISYNFHKTTTTIFSLLHVLL